MSSEVLIVLTNLPDRASADSLADRLVSASLTACVNILAPCQSVYRWKGELRRDEEYPLLIKTTRARYADLEAMIRANHPYEVPEVIAIPVVDGSASYLQWVAAETRS